MRRLALLLLLISVFNAAYCFLNPGDHIRKKLVARQLSNVNPLPEKYGPFWYDQPVDHFLENSTTFKNRYWANSDWYEPGGPVILYNAGEMGADPRSFYVTNSSMAQLAQRLNGIILVMEHRFYGLSMPSSNFTAESLATLNTAQALEDIADFIRFAKIPNVELSLDTKYIVYGGSYSGNLAAWMRLKYPDLVFAAVPSSAPVQMKFNYYEYFDPINQYGPKHCIDAIKTTILYIDHILFSPFEQAKKNLKKRFGIEDLQHDDDFAELLSYPLGLWQDMQPFSNPFQEQFCSVFDGLTAVQDIVDAYANYTKDFVKEACQNLSINECLDSHDARNARYIDLKDESRAWFWQVCTEYAYWQTSSPVWRSTLVSRKLQTSWYQRQCPLMFGEHNVPTIPKWDVINREYEGWHMNVDHIFWIDGEWDPWRTLSVQSNDAPDRSNWEGDSHYVVLPEAVHHWDFFTSDSVSDFIRNTQDQVHDTIKGWIEDDIKAKKRVHIQSY